MMVVRHFPRISAAEPTSVAISSSSSSPLQAEFLGTTKREDEVLLGVRLSQKSCNITIVGEGDLTSPKCPFGHFATFRHSPRPLGARCSHSVTVPLV